MKVKRNHYLVVLLSIFFIGCQQPDNKGNTALFYPMKNGHKEVEKPP